MEKKQIGNLENHYGPISAFSKNGKYYWAIEDYDGTNTEAIPAFLYTALMKFANIQSSKNSKSPPLQHQALLDHGKERQFKLEKEIDTPSFFLPIGTVFTYNTLSNSYSATTEENRIITYKKSDVEGSKFFSRVYSSDQADLVDFITQMREYWKGKGHKEVIEVGIRMLKHFDLKEVKEMIETISNKVQSNYE
jgi:hypothetical protein